MCYVSPASPVTSVCSKPQNFKQELFFKQLTGFYFFYPRTERTPLGSKCDKTHIHNNPQYEATAHFIHVQQLLTAPCGIIPRQCMIYTILVFHQEKN